MYYFYRKSNRGHGICPLYRGCPPFGESVIRGFTVYSDSAKVVWLQGIYIVPQVLLNDRSCSL